MPPEPEKPKKADNVILIGGKPFENYVNAVVTQFTLKKSKEVIVKARGKFISRAVDVTLLSQRVLVKEGWKIDVKDVKIADEKFKGREEKDREKQDKEITVSAIEITMAQK